MAGRGEVSHGRPRGRPLRIHNVPEQAGRSVAVIGSGVAGLTAAYLLSGRHRVTLYEAESYLAGEWESDTLPEVLTVLATDIATLVRSALQWLRPIVVASQPDSATPSRVFDRLPASWPDLAGRNDTRSTGCWTRRTSAEATTR